MSHYKGGGAGPTFGLTKFSALPNMLPVFLKAGQTIFWDGDLIHRGMMNPDVERATLHCSIGVQPKRNAASPPKTSPCDKRCGGPSPLPQSFRHTKLRSPRGAGFCG